jgi:hypothetical protein
LLFSASLKTAANGHVREIFIDLLQCDAEPLGLDLPASRHGRRCDYSRGRPSPPEK